MNMDFGDFFGGGGHGFHEPQEEVIPDLFLNSDVITLNMESISQFYRRSQIWILYFMDAKNEDCTKFKDEYVLTAEKLYGIIKVAAIDCGKEEELCNEEFGVFDIPQVMIYTEKSGEEGERFKGEMKQPHISRAATRKMQSFVSIVSNSNYDSFVDRDRWTKNKVILFNDKKITPSVYKAHSKKFLGKLDFAETRNSETELIAKFGIDTFPTLLVLTDPEGFVGDKYTGEMKPDQVEKFLSNYAYSKPKKVVKLEFLHLDERKYNANTLCGKKTTELCVLINAGSSDE